MGNPFVHIELSADDVAAAKKFYKSVFDWKLKDVSGPYTMIDVGKGTGGGMAGKQMPNQPTMWLPYVEVTDVKKTIAKAQSAGAKVLVEYMPIGEMGAIGVFVDPQGAPLGVWEMTKKAAPAKRSAAKKTAKKAKVAKKKGKR